ncbi:hypothetical protein K4F52_010048 [Lecanicillium sp. MT-2017a]|nr:hypothetical protein K4F52_010048 [Lecanicillium sp. MT-2017a]
MSQKARASPTFSSPHHSDSAAFLPLMVIVADHGFGPPRQSTSDQLGNPARSDRSSRRRLVMASFYALCALLWALASVAALSKTITSTGVVCPFGSRIEKYVALLQLLMCALDATLITVMTRLRVEAGDSGLAGVSDYTSNTFLVSAVALLLPCIYAFSERQGLFMAFNLHALDIRDMLLDSILATGIIVSAMSLLALLHPTTVALIASSLLLFGFQIPFLNPAFFIPPLVASDVIKRTAVATALLAPLLVMAPPPRPANANQSTTANLHKRITIGYGAVIALFLVLSILFPIWPITRSTAETVRFLTASSQKHMQEWTVQAASSKTLDDAVREYKRRYKISPPPNFDKWYNYATEHNSPIVDDFDQIYRDLLPFWGLEPKVIREQTQYLMTYERIGMAGLRFHNGILAQSPSIPGTHHWMTDTFDEMTKPFAQWLPDMDLVMNLADECHVTVPYEKMQEHLASADKSIQRAASAANVHSHFSLNSATWPSGFPEIIPPPVMPAGWRDLVRTHLFEDHVSNACAPSARARRTRWWDWSAACGGCAAPHSLASSDGLLLANTTLALDLCHQPDMSYLNGFIMSPGSLTGSNELFPVFSQSRISGFTDILFPSPWDFAGKSDYNEEADLEWDEKANSLYWRGTPSDGLAAFGTWAGYLRARFVHEAYEHTNQLLAAKSSSSSSTNAQPFKVNASFVGEVSKCDARDCRVETETFKQWGLAVVPPSEPREPTQMPPPQPYEENFRHKYLMDMDGAGFSGRFIPFLKSRSLVYRAAVFHTWVDERVKAWQHYIPVDARLGSGFWATVDFLAGLATGGSGSENVAADGDGEQIAKRVAEQGREWAGKALRKEDMQIYLFRLMLEWARVLDDDRENIGFNLV